jgi:hypothetical protein
VRVNAHGVHGAGGARPVAAAAMVNACNHAARSDRTEERSSGVTEASCRRRLERNTVRALEGLRDTVPAQYPQSAACSGFSNRPGSEC